jgi:signal transduction histidine kinase
MHWQQIAECLRLELADYGGLLRLMEIQQRGILGHDADAILRCAAEIEALARTATASRIRREQAVAAFAHEHRQPGTATLHSLLPLIEVPARPLLEALAKEVKLLLHRLHRLARLNRSLHDQAVGLPRARPGRAQPRLVADEIA